MAAARFSKPEIDNLVAIARDAGRRKATRRTIRYWVSDGLLDGPTRSGSRWLYPHRAIGQADLLARYPRLSGDARRFGLYVETKSLSHDDALSVAARLLAHWRDASSKLREEAPDLSELTRIAITSAHSRGEHAPFPREVQMSEAQREDAFLFLAGRTPAFAGLGANALGDQAALERMFGLRSGRSGADRDLSPMFDLAGDLAKVDPEVAYASLGEASAAQAEVARRLVELICVWMLPVLTALPMSSEQSFAGFLRVARTAALRFTPITYVEQYAVMLSRIARLSESQLEEVLSLAPASVVAMMLAQETPSVQSAAIRALRPWQRFGLEFVLAEKRQATRG